MLVKRLIAPFRMAMRWDRAAERAAKAEYKLALMEIQAAEKSIGVRLPPYFLLLKAVLLRQMGNPELAMQCTIDAHKEIKSYSKFSKSEKSYLECFASVLGLRIMQEQGYSGRHDFSVDYALVDLDRVRNATKRVFPMREHPAWKNRSRK